MLTKGTLTMHKKCDKDILGTHSMSTTDIYRNPTTN